MDVEKISEFIKKLRIENGYSQNTLSEKLHVTRQAISNWETGKAIPDSQILLELSKLFNVSINSILSGEITDNSLEEIALNLVDENIKKKTIIKKLLLGSTSLIVALLILFLGYYFFLNYNSIKVYKINGNSDKFVTYNGLLMTTKNKTYIRVNELEPINKQDNYNIKRIKLYYLDKTHKKVIIYNEDSESISIENLNGYNEYYKSKNKKYLLNNLYLEIIYNNNQKDLIRLSLKQVFSNNFDDLNNKEKSKVTRRKIKTEESNNVINEMIENEITKTNLYDKVRHEIIVEDEPHTEKEIIPETNQQETVIETKETNHDQGLLQNKPVINEENDDNDNQIPIDKPTEENYNIDYNEIANLLKENGIEEFGTYKYEYIDNDGRIVSINSCFNTIEIAIMKDNTIYDWIIFYNENEHISYKEYQNYIEITSMIYAIDYYNEELNLILLDFKEKTKSNL